MPMKLRVQLRHARVADERKGHLAERGIQDRVGRGEGCDEGSERTVLPVRAGDLDSQLNPLWHGLPARVFVL